MLLYRKVGICLKPTEEDLRVKLSKLLNVLLQIGCEVYLDERSAKLTGLEAHDRDELGRLCDLVVVLGGDGTMLSVARSLAAYGKPILGVNAGRLGFITDVPDEEVERLVPEILQGRAVEDSRPLLEGAVVRGGEVLCSRLAVNDVGVSHGRAGGMVDFVVRVNGRQMACQSADGVICSTATGSTAYSLAAGGPILHPSLEGMILVPVAPHTLSNRPIVLPLDSELEIELLDARDAVAYFDMQEFFDMQNGDRLVIRRSEHRITMLHPQNYDYFALLRQKLKWNFMPKEG